MERPDDSEFRDRVLDVCESTNDLARRLGENLAPHGSWVSAREQTAGRGRHGRSWISEPGNLFLSVLLRDVPPRELGWVPLLTASLLVDALDSLDPSAASGPFASRIKWPNDVGVIDRGDGGFRKGAGILCEGVSSGTRSFLVVGIGVNCSTEIETDRATWCFGVDADELRTRLVRAIRESRWSDPSALTLRKRAYAERSLLRPGDPLDWRTLAPPERDGSGVYVGLGEYGELLVRDSDDVPRSLTSEEIRLRIR